MQECVLFCLSVCLSPPLSLSAPSPSFPLHHSLPRSKCRGVYPRQGSTRLWIPPPPGSKRCAGSLWGSGSTWECPAPVCLYVCHERSSKCTLQILCTRYRYYRSCTHVTDPVHTLQILYTRYRSYRSCTHVTDPVHTLHIQYTRCRSYRSCTHYTAPI